MAAGSDQGVAMARSFGDLSHAVFVPVEPAASGAGELLIIDYWNSVEGLRTFFADPSRSSRAAPCSTGRPRRRWSGQATPGLPRFSLPAPTGRNERYVGHCPRPGRFARSRREDPDRVAAEAAPTPPGPRV